MKINNHKHYNRIYFFAMSGLQIACSIPLFVSIASDALSIHHRLINVFNRMDLKLLFFLGICSTGMLKTLKPFEALNQINKRRQPPPNQQKTNEKRTTEKNPTSVIQWPNTKQGIEERCHNLNSSQLTRLLKQAKNHVSLANWYRVISPSLQSKIRKIGDEQILKAIFKGLNNQVQSEWKLKGELYLSSKNRKVHNLKKWIDNRISNDPNLICLGVFIRLNFHEKIHIVKDPKFNKARHKDLDEAFVVYAKQASIREKIRFCPMFSSDQSWMNLWSEAEIKWLKKDKIVIKNDTALKRVKKLPKTQVNRSKEKKITMPDLVDSLLDGLNALSEKNLMSVQSVTLNGTNITSTTQWPYTKEDIEELCHDLNSTQLTHLLKQAKNHVSLTDWYRNASPSLRSKIRETGDKQILKTIFQGWNDQLKDDWQLKSEFSFILEYDPFGYNHAPDWLGYGEKHIKNDDVCKSIYFSVLHRISLLAKISSVRNWSSWQPSKRLQACLAHAKSASIYEKINCCELSGTESFSCHAWVGLWSDQEVQWLKQHQKQLNIGTGLTKRRVEMLLKKHSKKRQ